MGDRLAPCQVLLKMACPRSFEILTVVEWEIELGSLDAPASITSINGFIFIIFSTCKKDCIEDWGENV